MKLKKLFAVAATLFVMGFSTFAFDGKTFWKEYGGGLKNGDSLVQAGVNLWLSDGVHPGFLWGTNAGATWFFTDKIAATIESGYPYWVNVKFTMKF